MLFFTRWKVAGILLTALDRVPFRSTEFLLGKRDSASGRPGRNATSCSGSTCRADRACLLEVDINAVRKDQLQALNDDVLRILRQSRIHFTGRAINGNSVEVRITRESDIPLALEKLRELSQPLSGILGSSGQRSVQITESGGLITLTPPDAAVIERIRQTVDQSIQIIERRVNELGLVEPTIQRQGDRAAFSSRSRACRTRRGSRSSSARRRSSISACSTCRRRRSRRMAGQVPAEFGDSRRRERAGSKYLVEKRMLVSGGDLDRRAAGLRPAQRRADRQLPLQFDRRAEIRRGDAGRMSASRSRSCSTTR